MALTFRFFDPSPLEKSRLTRELEASPEAGYVNEMQVFPPRSPMTAHRFMTFLLPWSQEALNKVAPLLGRVSRAMPLILSTIKAPHSSRPLRITLVRMRPTVERGASFTMGTYIFLSSYRIDRADTDSLTKTIIHELSHVLQRTLKPFWDAFYASKGWVTLPPRVTPGELRNHWERATGMQTVGNPDTYAATFFGIPLNRDASFVLASQLSKDPDSNGAYREAGFIVDTRDAKVVETGWLEDLVPKIRARRTLPDKSEALLRLVERRDWQGAPNEIYAREFSSIA